jgi:hypothetical protein
VKTRTLLLLALGCGIAILAAGVAQFVRLSQQDDPATPVAIGASVTVGDLDVVVEGVDDDGATVEVRLSLGGVEDPDAADGFRLVVPGAAIAPSAGDGGEPPSCRAATVAPTACRLRFELPAEPGSTRVLVLRRGDEQVRWDLITD